MTIKSKILIGTSFYFGSIILLGSLAVFNQINTERQLNRITYLLNRRINTAKELQDHLVNLLKLSKSEKVQLFRTDSKYFRQIISLNNEIENLSKQLRDISSFRGKRILIKFSQDYQKTIQQALDSLKKRDREKNKIFNRSDIEKNVDQLDALMEQMIQYNREAIINSQTDALSYSESARILTLSLCGIAVLFAAGGWLILRKTYQAFQTLVKGIENTKENQYETIPITSSARDEINLITNKFNEMVTRIKGRVDDLNEIAVRDGLTGLFNHRYFQERLTAEMQRTSRIHNPLSLIMLDIDHFKSINDQHGHRTGDAVLQQIVKTILTTIRGSDIASRYGGEEFAIILPDTNKIVGYQVAEKIRKVLEQTKIILTDLKEPLQVTISCGIAACPFDATKKEELIHKSDLALYQAKATGRNKTVGYEPNLKNH